MNGSYFVQVGLNQEGKATAMSTGQLIRVHGHVAELVFHGEISRRKLVPLEHPLIQSLELFNSQEDMRAFLTKAFPAQMPQPKTQELPVKRNKPTTLRLVQSTPAPEEAELEAAGLSAELEQEEDEVETSVVEEETPPARRKAPADESPTDAARRLARSSLWQVKWKGDLDDTYVSGCSSPREVKNKINKTFGPQRESDYLTVTRVLPEDIDEDRTVI